MKNSSENISKLQKNIASNVKNYRLKMGMSQEEFSDICGYHRTYIGSIERSERNITISTLSALATALKVEPSDLLEDHG